MRRRDSFCKRDAIGVNSIFPELQKQTRTAQTTTAVLYSSESGGERSSIRERKQPSLEQPLANPLTHEAESSVCLCCDSIRLHTEELL